MEYRRRGISSGVTWCARSFEEAGEHIDVRSALGLERGHRVGHGKYTLTQPLGAGGMAEVWEAEHQITRCLVALKFLRVKGVVNPRERARFFLEARHTILHEHIVRIHDVGELNEHIPFLVMERLMGRDLRQELRAARVLSLARTANIFLQIMSAVAAAHAKHIVHRDLKPSNIFLQVRTDGADHAKLLDFGIAKALDVQTAAEGDPCRTRTREMMGTPGYMAPEQVHNAGEVGLSADVWALGVVLYECLAGRRMWPSSPGADDFDSTKFMHTANTLRAAVDALPAEIPDDVRALVLGALEVNPTARVALPAMFDILSKYATQRVPLLLHETPIAPGIHDKPIEEVTSTRNESLVSEAACSVEEQIEKGNAHSTGEKGDLNPSVDVAAPATNRVGVPRRRIVLQAQLVVVVFVLAGIFVGIAKFRDVNGLEPQGTGQETEFAVPQSVEIPLPPPSSPRQTHLDGDASAAVRPSYEPAPSSSATGSRSTRLEDVPSHLRYGPVSTVSTRAGGNPSKMPVPVLSAATAILDKPAEAVSTSSAEPMAAQTEASQSNLPELRTSTASPSASVTLPAPDPSPKGVGLPTPRQIAEKKWNPR